MAAVTFADDAYWWLYNYTNFGYAFGSLSPAWVARLYNVPPTVLGETSASGYRKEAMYHGDQERAWREKIAAEIRAVQHSALSTPSALRDHIAQLVEDGPIDVTKPVTLYTSIHDPRIKAAMRAARPYTAMEETGLGNMVRRALIAAQEAVQ
jgi:hypothetical protein